MPELTQAQRDVLTKEELDWLGSYTSNDPPDNFVNDLAASLAKSHILSEARRKMLKKHEWGGVDECGDNYCLECGRYKDPEHFDHGHAPTCTYNALAKEE